MESAASSLIAKLQSKVHLLKHFAKGKSATLIRNASIQKLEEVRMEYASAACAQARRGATVYNQVCLTIVKESTATRIPIVIWAYVKKVSAIRPRKRVRQRALAFILLQ